MTNKNIDVYTLIKPEVLKLRNIGVETANLDCRLLLSKSLRRREPLYNHQNIFISQNEIAKFQSLIQQRLNGKPVSRIVNSRNFWKKEFKLNDETLDQRSESDLGSNVSSLSANSFFQKFLLLIILETGFPFNLS